MVKLEIISNKVLEEDIIEVLEGLGYGENFTTLSPVFGRGRHGRREGSAIWPEENIMFIIYVEDKDSEAIVEEMKKLKEHFAQEGFRCYVQKNIAKLL